MPRRDVRRSLPNALTIARFVAIPVFVWLYLAAGDGPAWGAGIFFAAAALTDQLDGYLARRWHVESRIREGRGPARRSTDDRHCGGSHARDGRIPIVAAVVILARDVALVLGYRLLVAGRIRARGDVSRQDGHVGAVRVARARSRDVEGHDLADRPALDRRRPLTRRRPAVRTARMAADPAAEKGLSTRGRTFPMTEVST